MDVNQLQDRYDLSRKALYDRLKALKIQLARSGNKVFANDQQLEILDELNDHLKSGGTLKNFSPALATTAIVETVTSPLNTVQSSLNNDTLTLALIDYLANLNQRSPLDNYRDLEEAMQNDWVLTSGELERLLGVSIRTKGDYCDRGCWRFTKAGRIGREQGWKVSKI
jgi:hypothetical protein